MSHIANSHDQDHKTLGFLILYNISGDVMRFFYICLIFLQLTHQIHADWFDWGEDKPKLTKEQKQLVKDPNQWSYNDGKVVIKSNGYKFLEILQSGGRVLKDGSKHPISFSVKWAYIATIKNNLDKEIKINVRYHLVDSDNIRLSSSLSSVPIYISAGKEKVVQKSIPYGSLTLLESDIKSEIELEF